MAKAMIHPGIFWAVMGSYIAALMLLGWISYKKSDTLKEFLIMGGSAGGIVIALAYASTQYSVSTFMGCSGYVYRNGWSSFNIAATGSFNMVWPVLLVGYPLLKIRKRLNILTLPDFMAERYYSNFYRGFVAVMVPIFLLPYMGVQIMGGGLVIHAFTGEPFWVGAVIMGTVIALYCSFGGIRGAILTDTLQGALMLGGALVLAIVGIHKAGGFGSLNSWLATNMPKHLSMPGSAGFATYPGNISQFVLWGLFAVAQPQLFTKFLAVRNEKELTRTMVFGAIFFFAAAWLIWTAAMSATKLVPGLTGKGIDSTIPLLALKILPFSIASLLVSALIAAGMSTIDSALIMTSSAISRDLVQNTFAVKITEAGVLKLSRAMVIALAIVATVFGVIRPGLIFSIVMMVFGGFGVLLAPIVLGLHWKRATREAAIWSSIVGLAFLQQLKQILTRKLLKKAKFLTPIMVS